MAPRTPSPQDWQQLSDSFGFNLTTDRLAEMAAVAEATFAGFARLDELPDEYLPVRYPRAHLGHRPTDADNPHHGWTWCCSLKGAADGLLADRRVAIKDNISVAGLPMGNGTVLLDGFIPQEDATVVTRILDAGGEIVGKTTVPAFCMDGAAITCYPGPQPTNPHKPEHCAGGSSAGSAIVLLTGGADLAVGGDQGGSIRIPASWSGCYGLKPTWGLVPYTGAFSIEATIDHLGPMAMTVQDCALLLQAMAGADGLDPRQRHDAAPANYTDALTGDIRGLRVGVLVEGFGNGPGAQPDVDDLVREAARRYAELGALVEEVSVPLHLDAPAIHSAVTNEGATAMMLRGDAVGTNSKGHYSTQLADAYGRANRAQGRDFPDTVKLMAMVGQYMSDHYNHHYYAKGQNLSRRLTRAYDDALKRFDVLLLPTIPMKAARFPMSDDLGEYFTTTLGMTANVCPFNVTGHPAMNVPCGTSEGLPVGMQIVGRHFDEVTVLSAAYAFQVGAAR